MIEGRDITVRYGARTVLDRVSLSVKGGELVGILGANGAGKSTLLRILAGVAAGDGGEVTFDRVPLSGMGDMARARVLGYLPQRPTCDWPLTVREVAALGRLPHLPWWRSIESAQDEGAVACALEGCALTAMAGRRVDTLSGGEHARAMLARLLAGEPRVMIADEPIADLDPPHRVDVMEILRREAGEGRGVLVALHDLTLADRYCDRVIVLGQGRVLAEGAPGHILDAGLLERAFGAACRVARIDGQFVATFGGAETGDNSWSG